MFEQAIEIIKQEAVEEAMYEEKAAQYENGSSEWYRWEKLRFIKEKKVSGQIVLASQLFGVDLRELEKIVWGE